MYTDGLVEHFKRSIDDESQSGDERKQNEYSWEDLYNFLKACSQRGPIVGLQAYRIAMHLLSRDAIAKLSVFQASTGCGDLTETDLMQRREMIIRRFINLIFTRLF